MKGQWSLIMCLLGVAWKWNSFVGAAVCQLQHRSTESLKQLFIGKCLHYQTVINKDPFCDSPKDCGALWELFRKAYEHQPLCNVNPNLYQPLLDESYHAIPPNTQLFWSGLYDFVSRYTNNGKHNIAISNTLAGYIVDQLTWCGSNATDSGNEENLALCPVYDEGNCSNTAYSSFWSIASINFASHAVGDIKIMLNASRNPAFRSNSFFTTKELPHINGAVVKKARIVLVHKLGTTAQDSCEGPSVHELKRILERKGIQVCCESNPKDVVFMLCADSPGSTECQMANPKPIVIG